MKTAIIGAGNMGGSIARGLAKGTIIPASDIIVSNPTQGKLDALRLNSPLCKPHATIRKPLPAPSSSYSPSNRG